MSRLESIDRARGLVMVLMAIDHVRVFAGVPAGGPDPAVFFTRWVTHFCAPVFVFLAGTSAYFYGRRHGGLSRFLVTRGLWLVFLELTVLRAAWTFNADAGHMMAGVIWVIGWSMIALAAISRLPVAAAGALGVAILAGHNLLDSHLPQLIDRFGQGPGSAFWKIAYFGFFAGPVQLGGDAQLMVLYSFVPWVGVIAAGYAFGAVMTRDRAARDRICLALGLGAIALFLTLRGFNLYGDPRPWSVPGPAAPDGSPPMLAFLSFLNTNKYPASFLFLLMTLGPAIAALPLLERARGRLAGVLALFGRVPFFYYVLHIPLIHVLALLVSKMREGSVNPWLFLNHPMGNPPPPAGYRWDLPLLYATWCVAVLLLYVACSRYAQFKSRSTAWWLRYL